MANTIHIEAGFCSSSHHAEDRMNLTSSPKLFLASCILTKHQPCSESPDPGSSLQGFQPVIESFSSNFGTIQAQCSASQGVIPAQGYAPQGRRPDSAAVLLLFPTSFLVAQEDIFDILLPIYNIYDTSCPFLKEIRAVFSQDTWGSEAG